MALAYEDEDGTVHRVEPEQLRAAYDRVEVTLDTIRELAGTRLSEAIGDASGVRSQLLGVPGASNGMACWAPIFGETDEGLALEVAHSEAVNAFVTIVGEIESRLADMQAGLLEVLASYESADADADEVLRRYLVEHGPAEEGLGAAGPPQGQVGPGAAGPWPAGGAGGAVAGGAAGRSFEGS